VSDVGVQVPPPTPLLSRTCAVRRIFFRSPGPTFISRLSPVFGPVRRPRPSDGGAGRHGSALGFMKPSEKFAELLALTGRIRLSGWWRRTLRAVLTRTFRPHGFGPYLASHNRRATVRSLARGSPLPRAAGLTRRARRPNQRSATDRRAPVTIASPAIYHFFRSRHQPTTR
jgi:hypothetical protein